MVQAENAVAKVHLMFDEHIQHFQTVLRLADADYSWLGIFQLLERCALEYVTAI